MYILGISSYAHESSCALVKDGQIRFVFEEERLNREKHTSRYPQHAIRQCLECEGIPFEAIDHVTFYWVPAREIWGNLAHVVRFFPRSLNLLTAHSGGGELRALERIRRMRRIPLALQAQFRLPQPPKVHFIEHHLAHAASAFLVSEFEEAAILTMDGRGEHVSTLLAHGRGNSITKLQEVRVPHSLGHLYAAFTDYLGFRPFFDEWKVMGLSAYGNDTLVEDFRSLVNFDGHGRYRLDLSQLRFHTHGQRVWFSNRFCEKYGPKRSAHDEYDQRCFDIAYALQRVIEEAGVRLANELHEMTGLPNLCMSGGVVLNCLMNQRIVEESPFRDFFFQPVAHDAGTSFGSALYFYHHALGKKRQAIFDSAYLGNEFSNEEIEAVLRGHDVAFYRSSDIARETAAAIADGKIVGWFQGRMEAGPRALGNRSITVDPRRADMKERLNARVKKREFFRPFAPSVLKEKVAEFFEMPKGQLSPYMIMIGDVREDKKSIIPAVTHVDGTARVHTVDKTVNPLFWQLIREFERITGVPVILNTSFNENEPIVCSPQDAVNCFLRTEFDILAIGAFLATK